MFACFFFFFQNPPIHEHWRAFFKPTLRNMTVLFFVRVFSSSIFCFFFIIKDRLCTYICYMPLTDPVGRWNGTVYSIWVGNRKSENKIQHERPRYWDVKVTETEKKRPVLVLEMVSVIIFGTRYMHKQCVLSHRQPDYIAEGKTFWVQHVVF